MREKQIETYLQQVVERNGAISRKFKSPNHRNVPDRLIFAPMGRLALVEAKKPKTPNASAAQQREHALLRKLGFTVFVIATIKDVNNFEREWLLCSSS